MYAGDRSVVSVLYREPKLLKGVPAGARGPPRPVSVLYREPKLLKDHHEGTKKCNGPGFSALP